MADPTYCSRWWDGCFPQSGFGFGDADPDYREGKHPGVDLGLPTGTKLRAGEDGVISFAGWRPGTGNTVVIGLSDGTQVLLGHLSAIFVKTGDLAQPGLIVGLSGASGNVRAIGGGSGAHVHFEVRERSGIAINPIAWLRERPNAAGGDRGLNLNPLDALPAAGQAIAEAIGGFEKTVARLAWLAAGLVLVAMGLLLLIIPELKRAVPGPAGAVVRGAT